MIHVCGFMAHCPAIIYGRRSGVAHGDDAGGRGDTFAENGGKT